jgi:hypothetical protein
MRNLSTWRNYLGALAAVLACACEPAATIEPATPVSSLRPVVNAGDTHATAQPEGAGVTQTAKPATPRALPPSDDDYVPSYSNPAVNKSEAAQRVIAAARPQFRRCYRKGLASNPQLRGRVLMQLEVGIDGAVRNVRDEGSGLPDATVVSCVLAVAKSLVFDPHSGGTENMLLPMRFEPPSP